MSSVVILGAGCSKAISDKMPLTDELGQLVQDLLASADGGGGKYGMPLPPIPFPRTGFADGSFEQWLSRLAEDQPDLLEHENLLNRSYFTRVSRAIEEVISYRAFMVDQEKQPDWLAAFVLLSPILGMELISFNYDTLIERAVPASFTPELFRELGQGGPWTIERGRWPHEPPASWLTLMKLHGSIHLKTRFGDTSSQSVDAEAIETWGSGEPTSHDPLRPDPLIVPPSSAKSSFYQIPAIRQEWLRAGRTLEEADELTLFGYSIPQTDLVVSGMLKDRLSNRPIKLNVVDIDCDAVQKRIESLGVEISESTHFQSPELYMAELGDAAIGKAPTSLKSLQVSPFLGFGSYPRGSRAAMDFEACYEVTREDRVLVCRLRSLVAADTLEWPKWSNLVKVLEGAERCEVEFADHTRQSVVGGMFERIVMGAFVMLLTI